MSYAIAIGALTSAGALFLLVAATTALGAKPIGEFTLSLLSIVVLTVGSYLYGTFSVLRSRDAGYGGKVALVSLIGVGALVLLILPSANTSQRDGKPLAIKVLRGLAGTAALVVGFGLSHTVNKEVDEIEWGRSHQEVLPPVPKSLVSPRGLVEAWNADMPYRVDEITEALSVTLDDESRKLTFILRTDPSDSSGFYLLIPEIKSINLNVVCNDLEIFLSSGYSIVYTYRSMRGHSYGGFTVKPSDCNT